MFGNETRGLAIAGFSATVFMGPLFAPFIGGFIVDSYLGWRWTVSTSQNEALASILYGAIPSHSVSWRMP